MKRFAVAVGGTSVLAILCGLFYIVDCRMSAGRNWDKAQGCYAAEKPVHRKFFHLMVQIASSR